MSDIDLPDDDVEIARLGFSARACHMLQLLGCTTVGDVKRLTDLELKQTRGLGTRTFREIRAYCPYQADALRAGETAVIRTGGKASEMTLRDHFAAQAMKRLVPIWIEATCYPYGGSPISSAALAVKSEMNGEEGIDDRDWLARLVYEISDAMIAARNGGAA